MTEIYLLMETTGNYDEYTCIPIFAFSSLDLAVKAKHALNDIITHLEEIDYLTWMNNAEDHLANIGVSEEQLYDFMKDVRELGCISTWYGEYPTYSVDKAEYYDTM